MKTRNKVLLTLACALLLVAGSVAGTLAWLTSTSTVTNTFTVGKVEITLDEAKVNEYGEKVKENGEVAGVDDTLAARVRSNEYKLIPGHTYVKDPIIHVSADSENCYLFVKIENGLAAILDADTIETQLSAKGWKALADNAGVYYYAGTETTDMKSVAKNANVPVFEHFKLKGAEVTVETLKAYGANTPIKVTAYAIQADGFEANAPAVAWTALNPTTGTT